jgi:hypothetical protein
MPTPSKGENRNHYINRAVREIMAEGLSHKQAIGKAEGMFDFYSKKKKKKPY